MAKFKPIDRKKASEQVAEQIRSSILGGILSPGQRLPSERDLAAQFDVPGDEHDAHPAPGQLAHDLVAADALREALDRDGQPAEVGQGRGGGVRGAGRQGGEGGGSGGRRGGGVRRAGRQGDRHEYNQTNEQKFFHCPFLLFNE